MIITNIGTILHEKLDGKDIALRGWIHRHRTSGNMVFAVMRDPTGILQITIKKDKVSEKDWKDANNAYVESSFTVTGRVKKDDRAPGGYEIEAAGFTLISQGEPFPSLALQSASTRRERLPSSLLSAKAALSDSAPWASASGEQ